MFLCLHRVRTDFWIQNSRLFPTFFQNNKFFFQTQGYQIGDRYRYLKMQKRKKRRNKSFFKDALQM